MYGHQENNEHSEKAADEMGENVCDIIHLPRHRFPEYAQHFENRQKI
jgi:hypothetical protein